MASKTSVEGVKGALEAADAFLSFDCGGKSLRIRELVSILEK